MKIKDAAAIIADLEKVDDLITNVITETNADELITAKEELRIVINKIKEIEI